MTAFLWTMIVMLALTCAGKLTMLASGTMKPRTPAGEAIDVFVDFVVIAWAASLLAGA